MRINLLIFTISIQRLDTNSIERSIKRKQTIEARMNEVKLKHRDI